MGRRKKRGFPSFFSPNSGNFIHFLTCLRFSACPSQARVCRRRGDIAVDDDIPKEPSPKKKPFFRWKPRVRVCVWPSALKPQPQPLPPPPVARSPVRRLRACFPLYSSSSSSLPFSTCGLRFVCLRGRRKMRACVCASFSLLSLSGCLR